MEHVKFVNQSKDTIPARTFVLLKVSEGASHHLYLPKNYDVVGLTLAEVPPGAWGEALDLASEPSDEDY